MKTTLTMFSINGYPFQALSLILLVSFSPSTVLTSIPTRSSAEELVHPSSIALTGLSSSPLHREPNVRENVHDKQLESYSGDDEEESQLENSAEYSRIKTEDLSVNRPFRFEDDSFSGSSSDLDPNYMGDDPTGNRSNFDSNNENSHTQSNRSNKNGASSGVSSARNTTIHKGNATSFGHFSNLSTTSTIDRTYEGLNVSVATSSSFASWKCVKDEDSATSGVRLGADWNSLKKCNDGQTDSIKDYNITFGFLSSYNQNQLNLGALRLAVERVNENPNLLPGRKLRYIAADIGSSDLRLTSLPIKIMTEMRDRGTIGFIGGPEDTCESEALVAAAWNLPLISYKCSDQKVSDKKDYKTFARTLPPSSKVSKSVVALLKAFNWDKVVLIVCPSKDDRYNDIVTNAFTTLAKEQKINITASHSIPDYIPENITAMEDIVTKTLQNTRVYVFIGEHVALVHLVRVLAKKGAFDNGEYIVITIDDNYNISGKFFDIAYWDPYVRNNNTEDMIKAYRSVLKLMPSQQQEHGSLGPDVKELIFNYSTREPFCVPFLELIFKSAQLPMEAAYLYDAVMIYAQALHETFEEGRDPRNGTALIERIRNKTYRSIQGFDVKMDENGDAEGNYTVVSLLPIQYPYLEGNISNVNDSSPFSGSESYAYHVNYTYNYLDPHTNTTVRYSLQPVGYFTEVSSHSESTQSSSSSVSGVPSDSSSGNEPTSQSDNGNSNNAENKKHTPGGAVFAFRYFDEKREIQWVSGKPPKAQPKCGFQGELCDTRTGWRTITICSVVAAVLAIVLVMAARHYRYEQKLACLLWKIDMQSVTIISQGPPEPINGTKNTVAICRPILGTTTVDAEPPLELACKKAYTRIGFYKGMVVAVKPIHKRSVDLTRNIRKELIQIRELRHENIVPFIGASVDNGNICILTAYSARGSLEDVLQNEDLHLDNMFLASLVADLIKGMIYLHDSEIISHGNLKSSNCLVDSRWVLQIADFGLHEFKAGQEHKGYTEKEIRKLLWRAPELLRDPNPPARGTQKGDVYSFGVVLYEMIGRSGPWGKTQLSIPEIIEKVTNPELVDPSEGENGYLRPSTFHLDCGETILRCIEACWEEDADLRPDFRFIRVRLKEMQAGLKPNIFDNMLSIMEKYACNLEDLVQERTTQLVQEKKKTDALLHRMLPKSVAEALKRGDPVEAESFDSVTIYFSDIVGFTALSAVSTPLQVVELLNDLYTCFDSIISNYDVYKVETIGDAYMVVSGLPIRNGKQHAGEIASMALHLLDRIKSFEIRHRPGERLKLRIGIHTGCVVAGVVGLKMPRYCLFGDTVNTASRMESSGEALKIHISNVTKSVLEQIGGYYYEERGIIPIKGKGDMLTHWLVGEDGTRSRKNSSDSNSLGGKESMLLNPKYPVYSSSPHDGVVGFGQDGGDVKNSDFNDVTGSASNNNNFHVLECDKAEPCDGCTHKCSPVYKRSPGTTNPTSPSAGSEKDAVVLETSSFANGICQSGITRQGLEGKPIFKELNTSADLSISPKENKKYDSAGHGNSIANGKVAYKPTTWLLAECQNGKVDHHGNLLKSIGGKYVSCSNVFQECKVNIIKELKKNGNTAAAAAAAAAFNCNNGRIGGHFLPSQMNGSTNRFRSAPIITFMESSVPNPNSAQLFAFEEKNFV